MSHKSRIWVDGCFDFFHHGHAGALQQARKLGNSLVVGIHNDEEILKNKGPVVMHLEERDFAVLSCRWTSETILNAPYVTDVAFMDKYNCYYVAHGDDITTDADGNDCYAEVKKLGRFLEFKRTPNISTTDLISRMLSKSSAHHLDPKSKDLIGGSALQRFADYSTNLDAQTAWCGVWNYTDDLVSLIKPAYVFENIIYVDGSFDLFHCGHMELLKKLKLGGKKIVVGVKSDKDVNAECGSNLPLMNVFERGLCVLQCRYVDGIVLNAPSVEIMEGLMDFAYITLAERDKLMVKGKFRYLTADIIVQRVLENREAYEERQRKKGVKSSCEEALKKLE